MEPPLRFGIVSTGFIAGVIADAIAGSSRAKLVAVSSRSLTSAQQFVAKRSGVAAIEGADRLVSRSDIDAIYIASPTTTKEEIALAAINAGKHVLVDKPFVNSASLRLIIDAAAEKGVVFMDATHFVHHPRTAAIRAAIAEKIGTPQSLHTTFYFPLSGSDNIRFHPTLEPMMALGDMAWYSMRAIVEYLQPTGNVEKVATFFHRDSVTNAVTRASGLITFDSGESSTYDVGYTAGTVIMNLELLGTSGLIEMDDFVLDWTSSFAFKNPEIKAGYRYRTGMATRSEASFFETASPAPQDVLMIDSFAALAASNDAAAKTAFSGASLKTQDYLDAAWQAATQPSA
jgi:predicted dehydrogenase